MGNVVTISCTCDYLVNRAARHRRAGRYDEAMALLWKARDQFGMQEAVELEAARVYGEMDCDEEAVRAYLRVVRLRGAHEAEALFRLSLLSAQRGDMDRAVAYFERFAACGQHAGVSREMAASLGEQLFAETMRFADDSRRERARALERRAAACLQAGKSAAAQRLMERALRLRPTAQGYTMLACCHLVRRRFQDAVEAARRAHRMKPGKVQTLCLLSDAYAALGEDAQARKAMYLAVLRAKRPDDLFAAAMECAKYGEDRLTLRLTRRLLGMAPYHTHGMRIRACALVNLGRMREAGRLWGRLCGLLPEDTVCEAYFRQAREGQRPQERLTLGLDVTHEEGVSRAAELISLLYASPEQLCAEPAALRRACRLCGWALHSAMTGAHTRTVALILLSALPAQEARHALLDALTDPCLPDDVKLNALQVLAAGEGFRPYDADVGGRLVRLAAGGVSARPAINGKANSEIVQRASDALSGAFPDAPQTVLNVFLAYLDVYGQPRGRRKAACVAALEYLYHQHAGQPVDPAAIAKENGITRRLLRVMARRMERSLQRADDGAACKN